MRATKNKAQLFKICVLLSQQNELPALALGKAIGLA